ncbi:uncharacterized protein LOC129581395 isoform X2 [Paramacrobiotus metropolitanus]|uniref:uncharacterized protein LOC129581395 isoform X2 n=1 Tax=Paramacrobiotus metropolitanus TaxID=2943436 RepID=UPI002445DB70|nr:uncharacterized protein LOC129581395 isoform X2 [Paramacrobiotus metropolitanus]
MRPPAVNGFLLTVPGAMTFVALLFALAGIISYEIFRLQEPTVHLWLTFTYSMYTFHEVNVIGSFITLVLLFVASIVILSCNTKMNGNMLKMVALVHAAIWTILLMVSSSAMVTRSWHYFFFKDTPSSRAREVDLQTVMASGVCGLCEMGCLIITVAILLLDRIGIFKTNAYQT